MRAQTPSYVVSVKLRLPETVENHLEKSFHIVNSAYNEALSFGLRRFPIFYRNMKDFLQQPAQTSRLAWYLN